jgi:hypothetical protein
MKTLSFVLALAFAAGAWADEEACINYDPGVFAPPRQAVKCRVRLNHVCRITTKLCGRYPGDPHAWCTRYPGASICHTYCQDDVARSACDSSRQCGPYRSQPSDCPEFYKKQLEPPHCKFCPTGHCRDGGIYCEPCPVSNLGVSGPDPCKYPDPKDRVCCSDPPALVDCAGLSDADLRGVCTFYPEHGCCKLPR